MQDEVNEKTIALYIKMLFVSLSEPKSSVFLQIK